MGKLAAHYKGGYSIEYQMKLDWFEILEQEKNYKLQKMENQVIKERSSDSKGNPIKLPPYSTIREEVDKRLEEHEKEIEEKIKNNVQ
jgi:hypothetical protein